MSSAEEGPGRLESLIGDMAFGITEEEIEKHAGEVRDELGQIEEALSDEKTPDTLREFGLKRKETIEGEVSTPPGEILNSLQAIYDYVRQKEQEGLEPDQILAEIKKSEPELIRDIDRYYGYLREQAWGYRVFQGLIGLRN
jgi:hypothetical protein